MGGGRGRGERAHAPYIRRPALDPRIAEDPPLLGEGTATIDRRIVRRIDPILLEGAALPTRDLGLYAAWTLGL